MGLTQLESAREENCVSLVKVERLMREFMHIGRNVSKNGTKTGNKDV